jgi:hypothetical protein
MKKPTFQGIGDIIIMDNFDMLLEIVSPEEMETRRLG